MLGLGPLVVLVAGAAVIVATHPEPSTGWAVWALSPLLVFWVTLVVGRGVRITAIATAAYALLFAAVAGLGDESYTEIARIVYLGLPFAGLVVLVVVSTAAASLDLVVAGQARKANRPRRRASLVTGVAVVATWLLLAQLTRPEVVVAEARSGPQPAVAAVRCDGDDTSLLTPEVRTQADGIHVHVSNETDHELELRYEIDGGDAGGGGQVLEAGTSTLIVPFAAETVGFACLDARPDTSAYATARVADPFDVAREPQVSCNGKLRRETLDAEPTADVVQAARRHLRARGLLHGGDRIVRAVAVGPEFPIVLLIRDDRSTAMVSYTPAEGGGFAATDLDFCTTP